MKKIIAILMTMLPMVAMAQQDRDVWLMGYEEYDVPWYGHARIDWNKFTFSVTPDSIPMQFDLTMATWVDQEGDLLLYTNGCEVRDAASKIITDDLNPGAEHDIFCPDYGYPLEGGAIFIQDPGNANGVLLVHQSHREDTQATHVRDKLYLSRFLLSEGGAQVDKLNEIVIDDVLERFVVTRHGNGRDWWIICPAFLQEKWYIIHVHPDGHDVQVIKTIVPDWPAAHCSHAIPSVAISPHGDQIARWNTNCGMRLYDWDRCTGQLSFKKESQVERNHHDKWGVGSVLFSPSGRYLYLNDHVRIYRYDTELMKNKIDTMFIAKRHWGMPLNQMGMGTNNRIYFSQPGSDSMMAMMSFLEASVSPSFYTKGLSVGKLYRGTMPVYINRTLGALQGSSCDTLMVSTEDPEGSSFGRGIGEVYIIPNPAKDYITIVKPDGLLFSRYTIFNTIGETVGSGTFQQESTINIQSLSIGWYTLILESESGEQVWLKMIKH